ncbi:NACHT, LRR and PYD domains-containing protein 12-like isoform X2 [Myxocyprinus asiaticus]|uniref:NACHT, LRR and PYD domains-containing protein 12-like isoform X2 n=1 Tax=Myxocyprinus asiaticus TaxID=70543 RepID=UPI002223E853|nr:NACHT, LRR and PYD domains-containing protein 12-like isoform X2 [Myxocyprinus asiaticus]
MMTSVPELIVNSLNELKEEELKTFKWHLKNDGPHSTSELENADVLDTVDKIVACYGQEESVKITVNILRKMNHNHLAEQLENKLKEVSVPNASVQMSSPVNTGVSVDVNAENENHTEKQDGIGLQDFLTMHKNNIKEKAEPIFEGKRGNGANLDDVFTELFITEGDIKDVNHEHEILKIDDAFKTQKLQDKPINCNDIFNLLRQNSKKNIVLTKGIAGIGKTVSVHKFILDWAEGKANQDIDCMFLLPFRDVNSIKDKEISLHELLKKFYPELKEMEKTKLYTDYKLVFVFDGLDESRLPLNFESGMLTSVEERSSVDELFTNLVKGNLLPSSLVWVTSRPTAANQIAPEYVGLFTEVRGFTDKQKADYFRKRIKDKTQASKIISHIKSSRSLYIMCHIPVFCWITATVLQNILIENDTEDIETTLTEMYIHFLIVHLNIKSQKYDAKFERERTKLLESNKTMIVKLAKLAFEQLKKGNIVFYEEDLNECGIDVIEDSEFIGMIAEIFKKEDGLHEMKVFSFVHLSVQEFLAALYVFLCYLNKNMEELQFFIEKPHKHITLHDLILKAFVKATKSQRGHLDLFLRFLVGISLVSSQKLLKGLNTHTEDTTQSITTITKHIKQIQICEMPVEASINYFYCLLELKDQSLLKEIQGSLSSDTHSEVELSPSMCSVLVYELLMSEKVLDEFNMKAIKTLPNGYKRLVPAVRGCRKAIFDSCGLSSQCCEIVASALQSKSPLKELDLSNNDLQDSGVKLLSDALKSPHCTLEILRLAGCRVTARCCESLALALQSKSLLRELDMSNNDLQDSGVKLLSDALTSTNCTMEILRLSICNLTGQCCKGLVSALQSSKSLLRELDLSNNDLQDSGVKLLSDAMKNTKCKLEILRLSGCMVTEVGCCYLASALSSNPSHLIELDLSYNHPEESGVKMLTERFNDPNCKLDKLNVEHGGESMITTGLNKYFCDLTLDPNTANTLLILSEGNRKVTRVAEKQSYPDHPERFEKCPQVLCRESLTGRCYWEAEWRGLRIADISVAYKGISRIGESGACVFGRNENSWNLACSNKSFGVWHSKTGTFVRAPSPPSNRIGVYLDWPAGFLSFYNISDSYTFTHIYTFNTTFTEPLYAGFGVHYLNSSAGLVTQGASPPCPPNKGIGEPLAPPAPTVFGIGD